MVRTLSQSRTPSARSLEAPAAEMAAAAICDQHGAALFSLAAVLVPAESAEAAVVDVICSAFPSSSMAVPMPVADMRRQLARRVYLQ